MGNADADASTKTPKSSSAQEQPPPSSPAAVYHDWASLQAYYNSAGTPPMPPPGFFPSPVASSPQGHPYVWGQHLMPPYGTPPPPYVAMYTHGGLYAHPSLPPGSHPYSPYAVPSLNGTAEASVSAGGNDGEGKAGDRKSRSPLKRSKGSLGSLGMLTGKGNEIGKASGASASGGISQSGDSGSEGSSEGSDANSQNSSQQKLSGEQGSGDATAQNGSTACSVSNIVTQTPPTQGILNQSMVMAVPPNGVSGPTTNLNIGMDYWGGTAPTSVASARGKLPAVPASAAIVPSGQIGTRDGVPTEMWIQDERELKRQRRKQSNRESARRSRLRKQAECEELAQRVETLREENSTLREELEHWREECEKLTSENASLTEKLQNQQGQDSGVDGHNDLPESDPQTVANTKAVERDKVESW